MRRWMWAILLLIGAALALWASRDGRPPEAVEQPRAEAVEQPRAEAVRQPGVEEAAVTLVDGRFPAREVSPGRAVGRSPLENAPGYRRPDDPEAESVVTGRRKVEPIDMPFRGGARSATSLASIVLDALSSEDRDALQAIRLGFEEFRDICWPEFPQSRPATNTQAEDAWGFLTRDSVTGIRRGLSDWGGQVYEFVGLEFGEGFSRYTNFNLYNGVRILARDASGNQVAIPFAHSFIERRGVWKIYTYKE